MSEEYKCFNPEYDDNKPADTILFGKVTKNPDGTACRRVELLLDQECSYLTEKNAVDKQHPIIFKKIDEIELYSTRGGQQKIACWLIESDSGKGIRGLHIARRTSKGVYGSEEITLNNESIVALIKYLQTIFTVNPKYKSAIPINTITSITTPQEKTIISNVEFLDLIRANINSIEDFYKLISIQKMELSINRLREIIQGNYKNEVDIQKFLKDNIWMFGNDYVYIIEEEKINAANILDVIPSDFESYIDIIEVKLPDEKLFNYDESHKNYYPTSSLTKAIAQTQNYIFELERVSNTSMYQQRNSCKIIRPKGIILFGACNSLDEDTSRYLRILNSSLHNIKIITYQQLLEKAQNTLTSHRVIGND